MLLLCSRGVDDVLLEYVGVLSCVRSNFRSVESPRDVVSVCKALKCAPSFGLHQEELRRSEVAVHLRNGGTDACVKLVKWLGNSRSYLAFAFCQARPPFSQSRSELRIR